MEDHGTDTLRGGGSAPTLRLWISLLVVEAGVVGFWVNASPEAFTAACEQQLERMQQSKFSRLMVMEVLRDAVGCPPPQRRYWVRPKNDADDLSKSRGRRNMETVFGVSRNGVDVTVRASVEDSANGDSELHVKEEYEE